MDPAFKQLWPHFFHPDIKQDYWIAQLVELIKVFEGTSGTIANEDMLLDLRDRIDKRLDTGEW